MQWARGQRIVKTTRRVGVQDDAAAAVAATEVSHRIIQRMKKEEELHEQLPLSPSVSPMER